MTDIVMLLRENADFDAAEHVPHEVVQMQYEAANEIERLREQVEKLTKERDEYKSGYEAAASKYRNLKLQMQEIINVC